MADVCGVVNGKTVKDSLELSRKATVCVERARPENEDSWPDVKLMSSDV